MKLVGSSNNSRFCLGMIERAGTELTAVVGIQEEGWGLGNLVAIMSFIGRRGGKRLSYLAVID